MALNLFFEVEQIESKLIMISLFNQGFNVHILHQAYDSGPYPTCYHSN